MRAAGVHRTGAIFHQRRGRLHERARRIDQIVNDQARAALDVADDVHDFGNIRLHTALIHNGQGRIHFLGEKAGALHAPGIR